MCFSFNFLIIYIWDLSLSLKFTSCLEFLSILIMALWTFPPSLALLSSFVPSFNSVCAGSLCDFSPPQIKAAVTESEETSLMTPIPCHRPICPKFSKTGSQEKWLLSHNCVELVFPSLCRILGVNLCSDQTLECWSPCGGKLLDPNTVL